MTTIDTTEETTVTHAEPSTALAIGQDPLARMAERYGTTRAALRQVCDTVCFKPDRDGNTPPPELRLAFYLVCEATESNPLKREIFALYDAKKNILMPYVSIDGWLRKANDNPAFDGLSCVIDGYSADGNPTSATVTIHRKDRAHPIVWTESWKENFKPNNYKGGPWYDRPERMLKWKCIIQGIRIAFNMSGVMDEQEAIEAIQGEVPVRQLTDREEGAERMKKNLEDAYAAKAAKDVLEADVVEPTKPEPIPETLLAPTPTWTVIELAGLRKGVTNDKKKLPYRIVETTDRETLRCYRADLFDLLDTARKDGSTLTVQLDGETIIEAKAS